MKNDDQKTLYSERLDRAIRFSARAHAGDCRKGTDIPYVSHPVAVAWLLERAGYGEDVVLAALLHDVLEDTEVGAEELEREFGSEVLQLVQHVSEAKESDGGKPIPWRVRKQTQIDHLREVTDERVVALKAADCIHNGNSILADYREVGAELWKRFNAGPADQAWRYQTVSGIVSEKLGDAPLARELAQVAAGIADAAASSEA